MRLAACHIAALAQSQQRCRLQADGIHRLAQVVPGGRQEARLGPVRGGGAVALALKLADQRDVLEAQCHAIAQRAIGDLAVVDVDAQQARGKARVDAIHRPLLHQAIDGERQQHGRD
ncbi:hypothetical protein FQZ97_1022510 [compost metagenome]